MTNINYENGTNVPLNVFENFGRKIMSAQNDCSLTSLFPFNSNLESDSELPLNEEYCEMGYEPNINELIYDPSEKSLYESLFEDASLKKVSLFSRADKDELKEEEILLQRKRYPNIRRRKENNDNIRKKIKRTFLNSSLIQNINMMIKNMGGKLFFKKFLQHFVSNVTINSNKELINMTLGEIFRKKEFYQKNDLGHYYHNIKLIESKEIQENEDLTYILNLKYFELYEEYINSKEFLIDVNRLKKNNDDLYIQRYINLARHFIDFIHE